MTTPKLTAAGETYLHQIGRDALSLPEEPTDACYKRLARDGLVRWHANLKRVAITEDGLRALGKLGARPPGPRSGPEARSGPSGPSIPAGQRQRPYLSSTVPLSTHELVAELKARGWASTGAIMEQAITILAALDTLPPGRALVLGRQVDGTRTGQITATPPGGTPGGDWAAAAEKAR